MNVGFIGLGSMGLPMARNLVKAGHTVTVWNRTRTRSEELKGEGARIAEKPRDACQGDAVLSMLSDDAAVESLFLGPENLIAALGRETVHISSSTIGVAFARQLTDAHRAAGRDLLAAPVFGRPSAAEAGQLVIAVAGSGQAIARCRPLLDALGQKTVVVGQDPSKACVFKLAGNFLIGATIEALGEAFTLLRKSGVDPRIFYEAMTASLFAAPVYKGYGSLILDENFQPAGFKVPLGLKDVRLVLAAADGVSVPMPFANIIRDHLLTAVARGRQDHDWSSLARVVAENAGL
jgi:3-hydroxyisobutyrate dehydrogenase-like beta-hydroxyacid dehydrogenase